MCRSFSAFGIKPIDFSLFYGKLSSRIHAAGTRLFTSANCPGCAGQSVWPQVMDPRFMARPDFVRGHTVVAGAGVCAVPGALESARYLSLYRCIRRDGTSPAGDDPRV